MMGFCAIMITTFQQHKQQSDRFSAVVTDIRLESRIEGASRWQVALDQTLFSSAAQTGVLIATAPSGAQLMVPVLGVVEEDGAVWHVVGKPLSQGTAVSGETQRADLP